ncbi:MAG: 5-oxoprolinase subunit PxpA [Sporomusaceae bacterium]|nr:5-oxoprolinase subunit PxpA [Sporomusaceae bacterium]
MSIDLNCDSGESFGVYRLGLDAEIIPLVTSVNIACGFHASDPVHMHQTVKLAKKYGAAVGAHPSYPDLVGFGRRPLQASPEEIKGDVIYQIGALQGFCRAEAISLQHVKAHGALYNDAAKDLEVAVAIAEAVKAIDPGLYLVCLSQSAMIEAAKRVGIRYVEEVFADRAYTAAGGLVSRKLAGAVIHDPQAVADRVVQMATEKTVTAIDGSVVALNPQTICLHGDTPGAVELAGRIRRALQAAGVTLRPFGAAL